MIADCMLKSGEESDKILIVYITWVQKGLFEEKSDIGPVKNNGEHCS